MGILVEVTNPSSLPVTVADAREQCALLDDTSHDTFLLRSIKLATKELETHARTIFMQRTMRLDLDGFRSTDIDLQVYPVQSVTTIAYDDENDAAQTVSSSDYYTNLNGMTPIVRVVDYWPATMINKPASVRITFVAGYTSADEIPEDIRGNILMRVYDMFENRASDAPSGKGLIFPYRRISV